jgi:hypothetical protein
MYDDSREERKSLSVHRCGLEDGMVKGMTKMALWEPSEQHSRTELFPLRSARLACRSTLLSTLCGRIEESRGKYGFMKESLKGPFLDATVTAN